MLFTAAAAFTIASRGPAAAASPAHQQACRSGARSGARPWGAGPTPRLAVVRGGAASPSAEAAPVVKELGTTPFEGMKPGTSGLRKKVKVVREGLYLHNFVQALFDTLPAADRDGATMVVSGDGRYYNREAIQTIIRIAAANGVGRLWVGKGGLMSTPAVSAVIR